MTITEFLNARLDEDERDARAIANAKYFEGVESDAEEEVMRLSDPDRVLAEVEAKRKIIAFHEQWPVLVTTEPKIELSGDDTLAGTIDMYTARMSQQIEWQTTQQYRARFGTEPPTAPMLLALAQVYAGHPDFEEEWRI